MHKRIAMLIGLVVLLAPFAEAQTENSSRPGATGWRAPVADSNVVQASGRYDQPQQSPVTPGNVQPASNHVSRAQVTKGGGSLPNDGGQVWREYDISPYTLRDTTSSHPEQAIVDWILRETGYEAWHSNPVALLSANQRTLRVYHTPQMQAVVSEIVDRFVNGHAENHGFGLRIITVDNPNWRTRALPLMKSIPVQSPGVQGWILAKEDAALLMDELKRRTDYREHNPPHQMVQNGQSLVISSMRPVSYTKGIILTDQNWPGYQPELGQLDSGFTLEFSPLLALDTATTDAVVKVRLAQIEKMLPVKLEVPSVVAQNQRAEVQVPQMTMIEIHERFRWPTDQVMLLSMGVVATPGPTAPNPLKDALPMLRTAPRADALLFVEHKGPVAPNIPGAVTPTASASRPNQTFHGRY